MFAACSVKYLQRSTHKPHVHTIAEKLSVSVLDANSRPSSLKSSTAYGHLAWPKPTLESEHAKLDQFGQPSTKCNMKEATKTSQENPRQVAHALEKHLHGQLRTIALAKPQSALLGDRNSIQALPGSDKISRTFLPSYWILSDKSSAASQTLCTSISSVTRRVAPQTS